MDNTELTISLEDIGEPEVVEMSPALRVYKDNPNAVMPEFQTIGSACFDLAALESRYFEPGEHILVPTGLIFDIPKGFMLELYVRSSMAYKRKLTLANNVGIIDSDYVDPLYVMLYNFGEKSEVIHAGERIAQARMIPVWNYNLVETKEKPGLKGNRVGGVGSTGVK